MTRLALPGLLLVAALAFAWWRLAPTAIDLERVPAGLALRVPPRGPALVALGAVWCSACAQLDRNLTAFQAANPTVAVVHVDVDDERDLLPALGLGQIPVLIAYQDGIPVAATVGLRSVAGIGQLLER